MACILSLLEQGADKNKIELWHHDVDGREGSTLMDWPATRSYCRAVSNALNIPIYFSWLTGGFEREMNRNNQLKAATKWQNPDGTISQAGGTRGKKNTRKKFPQVSADLSVRWCSAYLKVDVCISAIRKQQRFDGIKTLLVTGERAEESSARANYKVFEVDKSDNRNGRHKRHVDRFRAVHSWTEAEVWNIIERWRVRPHPAYLAGFGRVSCQFCIFGNPDQWASAREISPARFEAIANYETEYDVTINRKENVTSRADRGKAYDMSTEEINSCRSEEYNQTIIMDDGESWTLPKGAFSDSCGPT